MITDEQIHALAARAEYTYSKVGPRVFAHGNFSAQSIADTLNIPLARVQDWLDGRGHLASVYVKAVGRASYIADDNLDKPIFGAPRGASVN